MATWKIVILVILAFNLGVLFGAWWRANMADDMPYEPYEDIPADDTYGRTARHLMEGK